MTNDKRRKLLELIDEYEADMASEGRVELSMMTADELVEDITMAIE